MEIVILSAVRTPIGKLLGGLSNLSAQELGSLVIKEAIQRAKISPEDIDEVIMGNVLSAGLGQNPARQSAVNAGIPYKVPAFTINKVCGSGMKAIVLACQAIKDGQAKVVVAGGMESMSNAPHILRNLRNGVKFGNTELIDSMLYDGLTDAYSKKIMGEFAELVAERYSISRKEQDEWALMSNLRAVNAQKEGKFNDEIMPVTIESKKQKIVISKDEGPREDSSLEKLLSLKPAFKSNGTVTAGNSSQISDGASALVISTEEYAKKINVKPLAKIKGYASAFVEPEWFLTAPINAIRKLEEKTGINIFQYDLIELNEAFAVQMCVIRKELKLDINKINVNGGAIALGHPIGASGARIITTLIYALKNFNKKIGLAGLCIGGGGAITMAIENVD